MEQALLRDPQPEYVFSATNTFVFLDGSNDGADALNTFLNGNGGANLTLIQNWVSNGGTLLLNAAPNVGGNINFGFGGVTLNYPAVSDTDNSTGPTDPIFSGPYGAFAGTTIPTSQTFTGGYFNHGELSGGGTTALLIDSNGQPSCAVIPSWGAHGGVVFGGMTMDSFHSPQPQAHELLENIIGYTTTLTH